MYCYSKKGAIYAKGLFREVNGFNVSSKVGETLQRSTHKNNHFTFGMQGQLTNYILEIYK